MTIASRRNSTSSQAGPGRRSSISRRGSVVSQGQGQGPSDFDDLLKNYQTPVQGLSPFTLADLNDHDFNNLDYAFVPEDVGLGISVDTTGLGNPTNTKTPNITSLDEFEKLYFEEGKFALPSARPAQVDQEPLQYPYQYPDPELPTKNGPYGPGFADYIPQALNLAQDVATYYPQQEYYGNMPVPEEVQYPGENHQAIDPSLLSMPPVSKHDERLAELFHWRTGSRANSIASKKASPMPQVESPLFVKDEKHSAPASARSNYTTSSRGSGRNSVNSTFSTETEVKPTRRNMQQAVVRYGELKCEKPTRDADKPWHRTNATTKGLTTRSTKINHWESRYEDRPHPIGKSWISPSGFKFKYASHPKREFRHELNQPTYKAKEINDFIFNYPKNKQTHAKLKLWIQKMPSDAGKRYITATASKCRFAECPAQIYGKGSILHGHYRVAFDDRYHAHRNNVDPFETAMIAHLYCMERFLDFEAICKLGIVEVDQRPLPLEPTGKFTGTLAGQPELGAALSFVDGCLHGDLRRTKEFRNYPVHSEYKRGAPKPHKDTLNYWMHKAKLQFRTPAQIIQFLDRGLEDSHLIVHLGDLDLVHSKQIKAAKKRRSKKGKKRNGDVIDLNSDDSDSEEEGESEHVKAAKEWATAFLQKREHRPQGKGRKRAAVDDDTSEDEAPVQKKKRKMATPKKTTAGRRKRVPVNTSSDESSDDNMHIVDDSDSEIDLPPVPPKKGFRESARLKKKPRKNYATPEPDEVAKQQQRQQQRIPVQQQQQQYVPQGYQPAAPTQADINAMPPGYYDQPPRTSFPYELNDPDLFQVRDALVTTALGRRRSSVGVPGGGHSRGNSLVSAIASPDLSRSPRADRKVSYGGVTTHVFDSAAAPTPPRRSARFSRP